MYSSVTALERGRRRGPKKQNAKRHPSPGGEGLGVRARGVARAKQRHPSPLGRGRGWEKMWYEPAPLTPNKNKNISPTPEKPTEN